MYVLLEYFVTGVCSIRVVQVGSVIKQCALFILIVNTITIIAQHYWVFKLEGCICIVQREISCKVVVWALLHNSVSSFQ